MSADPLSSAAASPAAPPAERSASRPARAAPSSERARWEFFRALFRTLTEEETYRIRSNPVLLLGFIMALPIPLLTLAAQPPGWLIALSIPAPFFWAVVLGAAGRIGIEAEEDKEVLATEVEQTKFLAMAAQESYEEALDEEVARRAQLEEKDKVITSELRLASDVHRTLVPDSIHRDDVEVAVRQIPTAYVGGDYLHATLVGDRYLYLIVGDVSGHGVAAALVVARLHGLIRRLTFENRARPVTILERVNRAAYRLFQHTYFFMTMAVFRLDLENGRLRYATAGHPPQALLRKDGTVERLRTPNRLLGIDQDIFDPHHPSDHVRMEPGDSLVLFTDGLYEILSDADGQVLTEEQLFERLDTVVGLSPALMAGEILQEMADFQGRSTFSDDVSLVVATYKGRESDA